METLPNVLKNSFSKILIILILLIRILNFSEKSSKTYLA
jgi:hypothetical protein